MTSRGIPAGHAVSFAAAVLLLLGACAPEQAQLKPVPPPEKPVEPAPPPPPAPVAKAERSQEHATPRRLIDVPIDLARLGGRPAAELWVTTDRGRTWLNHGAADPAKASVAFLAPADGPYGFVLVPVAADGTREFTPKPGELPVHAVLVDTAAPAVELLTPNGGEVFGTRRATVVRWAAQDANAAPGGVTIELSTGGTDDWVAIAKDLPNTGSYHWDIGAANGENFRLRVIVRDLAGNTGQDASDKPFSIDGLPPAFRITGPATATAVPVPVDYSAVDLGGSGLKKAVLWVTKDGGQTWAPHAEDEDLRSPVPFQDLDGVYGLRMAGEDRVGNVVAPPRPGTPPQATLRLDRTAPEVKLLAPAAAGYLGGVPLEVRWAAKDSLEMAANPVSIHFSEDAGKTWKPVATGLKNDGLHAWTPPKATAVECRLKVIVSDLAGNVGEAVSGRFGLDDRIPEARATGPDRSGSHQVQVGYEIRNRGAAPLSKVVLWYRPENAKEWTAYAEDVDLEPPMLFAKADGTYALAVTCETEQAVKAGLAQKPPSPGLEPQLTLVIDATLPQLSLETFNAGGFVAAQASHEVQWKFVEPHPDPRGLQIHHSADGGTTWVLVAGQLDPTLGKYRWAVPPAPGARNKLRLSAADRFGNRAETVSERMFVIDDDLPTVVVLERPAPSGRSNRVALKYKAYDATSGVDRVQLQGRLLGPERSSYRLLSEKRTAEGTLEAELPGEGRWALLVVAVDGAGLKSAEPERTPRHDADYTVDLLKPQVEIKSTVLPNGARTYVNAGWELEWRASDATTASDRLVVRIELSSDEGQNWQVLFQKHPNTGKADLRAQLTAGRRCRLRMVAVDEAGNEGEAVSGDFDPGDLPPPSLVLRGIEEGRQYPLRSEVTVTWASADKTIREADLELSTDNGRTWTQLAKLSTSSMNIPLPAKEGRYHARILARDIVRRPFSSNFVSFDMIAGVEPVRIIAPATALPGKLVPVVVEPKHILRVSKELRLDISSDGLDWKKAAEVRDTVPTFTAPVQPGTYVLRVVVTTHDGKEYDSNQARFSVAAGGLKLLTFRGGDAYDGGTQRIIHVRTDAELSQVRVELSTESGKDGTWKDVPKSDLRAEGAGIFWRLPEQGGGACRLRVSVKDAQGKVLQDESEKDFAIRPKGGAPTLTVPPTPDKPPAAGGIRLDVAGLPAVVKGGTTHTLRWSALEGVSKVKVLLVAGGTSEVLAANQPGAGSFLWTAPRKDLKGCRLRVEAGTAADESALFEIDSTAPSVDGVEIEVPGK